LYQATGADIAGALALAVNQRISAALASNHAV
jgi:hypothetical protein